MLTSTNRYRPVLDDRVDGCWKTCRDAQHLVTRSDGPFAKLREQSEENEIRFADDPELHVQTRKRPEPG